MCGSDATFTRVILLPQGKFDEFIKGSAAKRREILRELAGFEIFERMRQQAQKQADLLKTEYEAVERQLDSLEAPTVESITEQQKELATLEQQLPTFNEAVLKAQKVLDDEEKLFKDITRLATLQQELASLNARGSEIENLLVRLQQAQTADQIKGNYALVQDARARHKQAQTATKLAQKCLTQAQAKLDLQKAKLDEAIAYQKVMEPQLKAREDALTSAKSYEYQRQQHETEVARAKKILAQRADMLALAVQELNNAKVNVQQASKQAEEEQKAIAQYSPGGTRLEHLKQVSPLLGSWKLIQAQTLKSRQRLEKTIQEKLTAFSTHQATVLKLEQAELALQEAQAAWEAAEVTNTLAIQKDHAAALRQTLHNGDSCPVCSGIYSESQIKPLPAVSLVDTTSLRNQKAATEKGQKATQNSSIKAEATLENLQHKELEARQDLATIEANLTDLQQQISTVLQTDSWEVDALLEELEVLQESDAKYHQAKAEEKQAAVVVRETQQALQSAHNTHATTTAESEAATKEVERWQQQLQIVELKLHELTQGQPYKTLLQALEREQQVLKLQLQQATESYQAAEKSAIQSEAENKQAGNAAASARIQQEQLQTTWEAALAGQGLPKRALFWLKLTLHSKLVGKKQSPITANKKFS